jgi:short-subunit dehydrogenase
MLAVTGLRTTIVHEYLKLNPFERIARIEGMPSLADPAPVLSIPRADYYILAAGVLHQKKLVQQTGAEIVESFCVNFVNVVRICEEVFSKYEHARVCVIGSESGYKWSFDDTYAGSKAAVHSYIENRRVKPSQQLVGVAPIVISDAGMTMRRDDYPFVLRRRSTVTSKEVAEIIVGLFNGEITLNNTVVRM